MKEAILIILGWIKLKPCKVKSRAAYFLILLQIITLPAYASPLSPVDFETASQRETSVSNQHGPKAMTAKTVPHHYEDFLSGQPMTLSSASEEEEDIQEIEFTEMLAQHKDMEIKVQTAMASAVQSVTFQREAEVKSFAVELSNVVLKMNMSAITGQYIQRDSITASNVAYHDGHLSEQSNVEWGELDTNSNFAVKSEDIKVMYKALNEFARARSVQNFPQKIDSKKIQREKIEKIIDDFFKVVDEGVKVIRAHYLPKEHAVNREAAKRSEKRSGPEVQKQLFVNDLLRHDMNWMMPRGALVMNENAPDAEKVTDEEDLDMTDTRSLLLKFFYNSNHMHPLFKIWAPQLREMQMQELIDQYVHKALPDKEVPHLNRYRGQIFEGQLVHYALPIVRMADLYFANQLNRTNLRMNEYQNHAQVASTSVQEFTQS